MFDQIQTQNLKQLKENKPQRDDTTSEAQTCEICEKTLTSKPNYINHLKTHISDHPCRVCCNSYSSKFKLNTHVTSHHQELDDTITNYVQCDFDNCTELFPSKLQLFTHKKHHLNIPEFRCDICGLKFSRSAALKGHKSRHETPLSCTTCAKSFANRKTLKEHQRLHTGEMPFECKECGKKFRCHSGLKYHETVHTRERRYKCERCGASFARSNYLKEHLRTHLKEKPYHCKFCPMKFIQLNILKRHEAKMHRSCDLCKEVIGNTKDYREHMWKTHS